MSRRNRPLVVMGPGGPYRRIWPRPTDRAGRPMADERLTLTDWLMIAAAATAVVFIILMR